MSMNEIFNMYFGIIDDERDKDCEYGIYSKFDIISY